MAIRFKFRSSVNFDSVDIDGQFSISVRDLKSKIVRNKHLNIYQDFDLLLCDPVTGQEYHDENFPIPSGSSVIVKRVPAGSVPSNMARIDLCQNLAVKDTNMVKTPLPMCVEVGNFDDFGVDLCPVPELTMSGSDPDTDKKIYISREKPRYFEAPLLGRQKVEMSGLSEGPVNVKIEEKTSQREAKPIIEGYTKAVNANIPSMQHSDLPSELKCSLCDTFFKEAMMIPCCQHSFCKKCISLVLVEEASCPKCLSTKCRVEDLLPNVSLRQAIDRFLDSKVVISGSDNAFNQYAPDGESGIQAKDVSCAVTTHQKERECLYSPSETERGSNQLSAEPVDGTFSHVNHPGAMKFFKSTHFPHKMKQIDGERQGSINQVDHKTGPEDLATYDDFQGESQPVNEEAESTIKRKRSLWVDTAGVAWNSVKTRRHRKGDRACYRCGSSSHLVRDCPAASSLHPMFQTGNPMFPGVMPVHASPYWNGIPYSHIRPFASPYGNSGIMPFNATMVPPSSFAIPTFMPSMFGGLAAYSGFSRMGGAAAPIGIGGEKHVSHLEFMELHRCEKTQKLLTENLRREQSLADVRSDDFDRTCCYKKAERWREHETHMDRGESVSHSWDSFTKRLYRKRQCDTHCDDDIYSVDEKLKKSHYSSIAGRDWRPHDQPERPSPEVEDFPNGSNWHSQERCERYHISSKKHEGRDQSGSDSSQSHHQTHKGQDGKRSDPHVKRHKQKYQSYSRSGMEPSLSSDQGRQQKERDHSHGSRQSRWNSRSLTNELGHDRWQMVSGLDEDGREDYCHHKRKRVY